MQQGVVIRGARLLLPSGWMEGGDVRIAEGRIERIGQGLAAGEAQVIDGRGCWVVPGFVDLHVHGLGGQFCESGQVDALLQISRLLARFGVTGFLATVATLPAKRTREVVRALAMAAGQEPGARILGIHLEGPFLNRRFAGAQNRRWMREPSLDEFDALLGEGAGQVRMLTLAPELPGAAPLVALARDNGVVAALGHSGASEEESLVAADAGASYVTHLFNAMGAFHHRDVGLAGVALLDPRLTVELIADGYHVNPRAFALAWRAKGPERLVLASDAVAAALPEGTYRWGSEECVVRGGAVRRGKDGRLAGSCLTLDQAVRNVRAWMPEAPLEHILAAASSTPCRVLGLPELGRIEEGAEADLVVLDDSLHVRCTIVRGAVVYEAAR